VGFCHFLSAQKVAEKGALAAGFGRASDTVFDGYRKTALYCALRAGLD
jgi:hypothetical protein